MKLIGIEEHFLTDEIHRAWNTIGLEAIDPSMAFHSGTLEVRLLNLAEDRLALMDETGLDVQVLSLTTPMLHDLGPESIDMARRTNDALLRTGLGTIVVLSTVTQVQDCIAFHQKRPVFVALSSS